MNVVFATAEMVPFAKTGGLADVCGSLPISLSQSGQKVKIFLPKYKMVDTTRFRLERVVDSLKVQVGAEILEGNISSYEYVDGVEVFFVENGDLFNRDQLYGTPKGDYPDNDKRFIFFQKAILETLKVIDFKPHIIHCHDWQTGLIPVYLKTLYAEDPFFAHVKAVFTIHNLAYQGVFPPESLSLTGLSKDLFTMDRLEFYGKLNFMKGGLIYADILTTVSKRYSQEIQLKEFGCGLEGVLRARSAELFGILNGLDYDEWNSETDPDLTVNFSAEQLDKKYINKGVLQKENNLPVDRDIPLLGIVTRLADQKGLDILTPIMPELAKMNVQFVLLGTGEDKYNKKFKQLGEKYPDKFGMNILFDPKMAKRIYSGSDIFLMPSYFEPCGLGQLIAFRYGTVPLVRETGGLADTVIDFNVNTREGTGFVFSEYDKKALLKCIQKAVMLYKDKNVWKQIVSNGAANDFTWKASAEKYIHLYESSRKKEVIDVRN